MGIEGAQRLRPLRPALRLPETCLPHAVDIAGLRLAQKLSNPSVHEFGAAPKSNPT
jgi:hypothetical protein